MFQNEVFVSLPKLTGRSYYRIAEQLNLACSNILSWKTKGVPAKHTLRVCELSGWQLLPHVVNPAYYPYWTD